MAHLYTEYAPHRPFLGGKGINVGGKGVESYIGKLDDCPYCILMFILSANSELEYLGRPGRCGTINQYHANGTTSITEFRVDG